MHQTASEIFKMTLYHHSPCALTDQNSPPYCALMRALFVTILLPSTVLSSGCFCFPTNRHLRGRSPDASYTGGSGQRGGAVQPRGLYVDGKGVVKDEKRGVEWMRKATEQGDANGQDSLNEMYCDGRGVQQDNVRAYMWFNLVVDNI
jgi:hypothetical protein